MARHANADWKIPDKPDNWTQVAVAVLMDIRTELQTIRQLAQCPRIPMALDAMASADRVLKRLDKRAAKKVKLP